MTWQREFEKLQGKVFSLETINDDLERKLEKLGIDSDANIHRLKDAIKTKEHEMTRLTQTKDSLSNEVASYKSDLGIFGQCTKIYSNS